MPNANSIYNQNVKEDSIVIIYTPSPFYSKQRKNNHKKQINCSVNRNRNDLIFILFIDSNGKK